MATVFTMIIDGDLPGRFVWRDEHAVAFLSINPLTTGHVLVVPVAEVDHWIDLDAGTWAHVNEVVRAVGAAIDRAFAADRVGTVIAGFEVPHVHVHVFPTSSMTDFDFRNAATDPDPDVMDDAAARIRRALVELGYGDVVSET
jgi:diadenosine tetraphosphate (Ap4A) HIT family hydrolase